MSLELSVDGKVTPKKGAGTKKINPMELKQKWRYPRRPMQIIEHPNNGQVIMLSVQPHFSIAQRNQSSGMPTLARRSIWQTRDGFSQLSSQ